MYVRLCLKRASIAVAALLIAMTLMPAPAATAAEWRAATVVELRKALSAAQPGDTIIMANGVWPNVNIVINGADGKPDMPITLRAETGGQVFLTGKSTLKIGRDYWIVDGLVFRDGGFDKYTRTSVIEFREHASRYAHHSRLTNTQIIEYNATDGPSTEYKWISLFGSHNRVDHNYISGKKHLGAALVVWRTDDSPNYHQIDHNYFGDFAPMAANGGETIRIGTSDTSLSASHTIVERNYFIRCNGEIELISVKSGNNIIRYNTIRESVGGITLRHGNNSEVYGNYIFGGFVPDTVGIRLTGEGHKIYNNYITGIAGSTSYSGLRAAVVFMNGVPNSALHEYYQIKNVTFAHNTLVDNMRNVSFGAGRDATRSLPPIGVVFANNLIRSRFSPLLNFIDNPDILYVNNILHGSFSGVMPGTPGITVVDPLLAQSEDKVWRPTTGSPAIDGATGAHPYIADDIDGKPRAGLKDIGAHEYSAAAATRGPLEADDVGPAWMRSSL